MAEPADQPLGVIGLHEAGHGLAQHVLPLRRSDDEFIKTDEDNCRQIAVRARRQVEAKKPRFEPLALLARGVLAAILRRRRGRQHPGADPPARRRRRRLRRRRRKGTRHPSPSASLQVGEVLTGERQEGDATFQR